MPREVITSEDLELEVYCWNCWDYRNDCPNEEKRASCDFCHGTGKTLTPFGKKVLEFVSRRLGVVIPKRPNE